MAVSVMTVTELQLGVLVAADPLVQTQRMATLQGLLGECEALPIDEAVAGIFAALVAQGRAANRKPKVIDALIAATAMAHRIPLYTQDNGFGSFEGLEVVLV